MGQRRKEEKGGKDMPISEWFSEMMRDRKMEILKDRDTGTESERYGDCDIETGRQSDSKAE